MTGPAALPAPAELGALMRRMWPPYLRKAATDVLATARAQRWDPAEVLQVLLAERALTSDSPPGVLRPCGFSARSSAADAQVPATAS